MIPWHAHLDDLRAVVVTELLVPRPVVFDEGIETRSWQLRAVIACERTDGKQRRNRVIVRCRVEDAALQASVLPRLDGAPPADAAPLLAEMCSALRSATVEWVVTPAGRQVRWSVEGLPDGSPRDTRLGRVLAVQLERAMAGLVLERPDEALHAAGQWVETTSPLLRFPDLDVSQAPGVSQQVHRVASDTDPVRVDAAGAAVLVDPATNTSMQAEARSRAELGADGRLLTRTWNVDGEDHGTVVYHHAGWMRRLGPDEPVSLGPTREVRAPGEAEPAHLPEWPPL